jgi:hypothetical protein
MSLHDFAVKSAQKAGNTVAKLSALSPEQLQEVERNRQKYLSEKPDPQDPAAVELTYRLLGASGVEIFNAYLPSLHDLYVPLEQQAEYGQNFDADHNIRYFKITKWVKDKNEKNLEKLVNVYATLSAQQCNIALIFQRKMNKTDVYLAVANTKNAMDNVDVDQYKERLAGALNGNFPGSEFYEEKTNKHPFFNTNAEYSVAAASNIPTEKSEKFISQTIEKLLDGYVPANKDEEYTLILLATPILDVEERKLRLSQIYSGLLPYASWQTSYTYSENNATNSSATVGVNVGASAGMQSGQNQTTSTSDAQSTSQNKTTSKNSSTTNTDTKSQSSSKATSSGKSQTTSNTTASNTSRNKGTTTTDGIDIGVSANADVQIFNIIGDVGVSGDYSHSIAENVSESVGETLSQTLGSQTSSSLTQTIADTASSAIGNSVGQSLANSLGKAVTSTVAKTAGVFNSTNFGLNFGANFARSSSVTATIGKNEGITQSYMNHTIKHSLELLDGQMKRYEKSTALGMWDFAAYVLSESVNMASNIAHAYVALTQGEESYNSYAAINVWRGDIDQESEMAREICAYLKNLRHPWFGLGPHQIKKDARFQVYPPLVNAATPLSSKELAYALNFPAKSVSGLPVIECAQFARNVSTYDLTNQTDAKLDLGVVYHMHHMENQSVQLRLNSLSGHTFITGSTGAGKSNTIYQMLLEARKQDISFLVVEPAKGEYKMLFGMDQDVSVYGTNPYKSPLLKINPFSFPEDTHILEHLDRLIEIFNVCWPMYAAMPAVLKNAVEKAYEACGWNLKTSKNIYGEKLWPTFEDVASQVKEIIDSSEYDAENKGAYKGSLLTRLQSLTNGINGQIFVQNEIPAQKLFDENVIIDLSRTGSSETKSLIMGILVLKLQEHRMQMQEINASLQHVTVLEEAHHLLKKSTPSSGLEQGGMLSKSVEMLANSIAEMRTYGEGFIIADQAPGLLDESVIRNTNTKILMRLPDANDRKLAGASASLNEEQMLELAKLPGGVGVVYQNDWIEPVLCKVHYVDKPARKYLYTLSDTQDKTESVEQKLKNWILYFGISSIGAKEELLLLKEELMASELKSTLKCRYLDYVKTDTKEEKRKALGKLMFEFFHAEKAVEKAQVYENPKDFSQCLLENLSPSISECSINAASWIILLLMEEKAQRDLAYMERMNRLVEIYQKEGKLL